MELFGIGVLELLFILVIILLVAGPKDIAKTARNLGRLLNRLYRSPAYLAIRRASDELRGLPQRLVEEAQLEDLKEEVGLQDMQKELRETANSIGNEQKAFKAWVEKVDEPIAPAATPAPDTTPRKPPTGAPRSETTAALKAQVAARQADGAAKPPPAPPPAELEPDPETPSDQAA